MNEPTLYLLLVVLLLGTLLCAVSLMLLRSSVQRSGSVGSELFSAGTVYPYSLVSSLRAKYFLPWVHPPKSLRGHMAARLSLLLVRVGAYIATAALLGMIAVGIARLWATS